MSYIMVAICKKRSLKVTIFLLVCICGFIHYGSNFYNMDSIHPAYNELDQKDWSLRLHLANVENFYRNRQTWPSSKLGRILFMREEIPEKNLNANRTFVILMWKHWEWLKIRHVYRFGSASSRENGASALSYCTVNNCIFSGEDNLIDTADAVVVHLQQGLIPQVKNRNPKQRWIFLTDESPRHTFSMAQKKISLEDLDNVFNWSMTYRSDADIPVPYGRTIPLDEPVMEYMHLAEIASLVPNWGKKRRDVAATVLMSNCGDKARNDLLTKFKKYIQVDVYGGCSDQPEYKKSCPGHFTSDCEPISRYKFYLVLENSSCFQYLSEKIFYHAYAKGAVPIIWGPAYEDVESLLPPHSFLYVDKDTNIEKLAMDIKALNQNDELMLSMHMWRNHFQIVNEHGYFGSKSYHLCHLCEAMNYNDKKEKTYNINDLRYFLDPGKTCLN